MLSEKQTVMVVDDVPENIEILVGALKSDYRVKVATSGEKALQLISAAPPDLVLLDIMMPEIDGYDVCRMIKANKATADIPIIFITAKIGLDDEIAGLDAGAVDYITKPASPKIVKARVQAQLALYDQKRSLGRQINLKEQEVFDTRLKLLQRLGQAAIFRNHQLGTQVERISHYTFKIGLASGMSQSEATTLLNASALYDIGKLALPEKIARSEGKLQGPDLEIYKKHCEYGASIIGDDPSELLSLARDIALNHHEKWDGTGYPRGIRGEDIPLGARIVALAETFDELVSPQPGKEKWTPEDAAIVMEVSSGTLFDPRLVKVFIQTLPELIKIRNQYTD